MPADTSPSRLSELSALQIAQDLGYLVVLENIDPQDWARPGTDVILQRIKQQRSSAANLSNFPQRGCACAQRPQLRCIRWCFIACDRNGRVLYCTAQKDGTNNMLYQIYEAQRNLMEPFADHPGRGKRRA